MKEHIQSEQDVKRGKYETVKSAILGALQGKSLTYTELVRQTTEHLPAFDGSLSGYLEMLLPELENKGIIKRDTTLQPARYRISQLA